MSSIPKQGIIQYQSITRVRRSGGGWVNSRYVDGGEEVLSSILASVQNPTRKGSEVIKNLPEGERLDSWKVIYCEPAQFRISDDNTNTQSDLVIWDGWYWDVRKINSWSGQVLTHDQIYAVRTDRQYVPPPFSIPTFSAYGGAFASYDGAFVGELEGGPVPSPDEVFASYSDVFAAYNTNFVGV